jgi:hypothetical protein
MLVPSNDNISAGDIVTLGGDGNAYWATDPANPLSALRPIFNAVATNWQQVVATQNIGNASYGSYGGSNYAQATLTNGNTVLVYGQSGTTGPAFMVMNALGQVIVNSTSVGLAGTIANIVAVGALAGGGFVIAGFSGTATTYTAQFAIYSNSGTLVTSLTNADPTTSWSSGYRVNVIPLINGNFALSWGGGSVNSGTAGYKTAVFSPTGSVVTAPFTLSSTTGSEANDGFNSCPLSGGGYVVGYAASGGSAQYAVLSAAGSLLTTASAGGATSPSGIVVAPTSTGGFVGASGQGSSTTLAYGNWTGSGSAIGTGTSTVSGGVSSVSISTLQGGGFIVASAYSASTSTSVTVLSNTASVLKAPTVVNTLGYSNFNKVAVYGTPDGGAVVANAYTTPAGSYLTRIASVTYAATTSVLNTTAGGVSMILFPIAPTFGVSSLYSSGFWIFGSMGGVPNLTAMLATAPVQVPIGIAAASAAPGSNVRVIVNGTVSTRLTLKQPFNVDARCNTPPGQAMNITGNVATLQGLQRTTLRNIN